MLGTFRKLFGGADASSSGEPAVREPAPSEIKLEGQPSFPIANHLSFEHGFPFLDWEAVRLWLDALPSEELQDVGWSACERGWLLHLRDAMGERYHLNETPDVILLSSMEARPAHAVMEFLKRTSARIAKLLDGIAQAQEWGSDILIVFDEHDDYYRYVSHYYPLDGEYSISSGMCLHHDCVHVATHRYDMNAMEAILAHEMTHGMLTHLPLPTWLNEGLAVNTEHRLVPPRIGHEQQRELAEKHASFWGEEEIQAFWSGAAFYRTGDHSALSYDLAKAMVREMARDWESFQRFANAAKADDAGHQAAMDLLGIDLGAYVANLLGRAEEEKFAPDPTRWSGY